MSAQNDVCIRSVLLYSSERYVEIYWREKIKCGQQSKDSDRHAFYKKKCDCPIFKWFLTLPRRFIQFEGYFWEKKWKPSINNSQNIQNHFSFKYIPFLKWSPKLHHNEYIFLLLRDIVSIFQKYSHEKEDTCYSMWFWRLYQPWILKSTLTH